MSPGSTRRNRKSWPLLAWVGVLCCCALLWGAEKGLSRRQRLAVEEARNRRVTFSALARMLYHFSDDSPFVFQYALNHNKPLKPLPSPDGQSFRAEWNASELDPQYAGWTVQLTFKPGTSVGSVGGLESAKTIAPPARFGSGPSVQTMLAMEYTRRAALLLAGGGWWLALLTMLFARPWRRPLAQVCLAAALLAGAAWWVNPLRAPGLSRANLVAPLPIAIGAAGFLALVALAIPVRRRILTSDQAPCAHCGYDLTGNVSGICPECGRITPKGRIDRWEDLAARIESDAGDDAGESDGLETPVAPA